MATTESDNVDVRKSTHVRRPVGSNIGVRRQRLPSHNSSTTVQLQEQRLDEDGGLSTPLFPDDDHSTRQGRHLIHQLNRSRVRNSRSEQVPTIRVNAATKGVRATARSVGPGNIHSDNLRDESFRETTQRVGSDSDSPPTILINPDLDILPVVKTHQARASFDFYVNSYVTSIIEVSPHDVKNYSHVIHQILHDEMLFTAFTTCSEAAKWRTQSLYDDPPMNVVKGYGKTISLLSERLRSGEFSPAVLLTMGQLVAIETQIKNVSATARHLAGMQSIMAAKNNAKPSPGSSPLQTAVEIWTKYFEYRARVKATVTRTAALTYPRHPFDPEVSRQISEMPIGFADIVLTGQVSTEMLSLLYRFNAYFKATNEFVKEGNTYSAERTHVILQQAAYCVEFTQIQTLKLIERLILAALTAYVVRRDRLHPALVNMRNYYQITCAYLLNLLTVSPLHKTERCTSLITWIGLTLLLTSTPEAYARKLALKLLPGQPEPLKILKHCETFFWDEDLTDALLSGSVLVTKTSNDVIADNVQQALPESES